MHMQNMMINTAPRFAGSQIVARSRSALGQSPDKKLPQIESANVLLSTMASKVCVVAGLLQSANDVHVFRDQNAHPAVELLEREPGLFGTKLTPAPLELNVPSNLVGWSNEVIHEGQNSNGCAHCFCETSELSQCTAKNGGPADQEHQTEDPSHVPVQLDMPVMQFDGVVDVQARFVKTALVAHELPLLGCRWRRRWIAVDRHLSFDVIRFDFHGGSLLWGRVLGSVIILACELSPFRGGGMHALIASQAVKVSSEEGPL